MTQTVLEVIGWIGSILIVWSLTQARVLRFRWMNLTGSVVATVYNAIIGVWPFAAMNAAIAVINIYWITRLYREAHSAAAYRVLAVQGDDAFVQQVIDVHADDIAAHHPGFDAGADAREGRSTFLVVRGDEAVGVVAVRDVGDGTGVVELDWVKERFRDFTPGEFVYQESQVLEGAGFRRLELSPGHAIDREYLTRVGFTDDGDRWVREHATSTR